MRVTLKDQLRKARPEQADRFPKREIHADTLSIVRMREAGVSYQEIANVLNLNKGWVYKLYKRATEPRDVVVTASCSNRDRRRYRPFLVPGTGRFW
jgi:DNA invertase Pin-like site-specific DNA recombinase